MSLSIKKDFPALNQSEKCTLNTVHCIDNISISTALMLVNLIKHASQVDQCRHKPCCTLKATPIKLACDLAGKSHHFQVWIDARPQTDENCLEEIKKHFDAIKDLIGKLKTSKNKRDISRDILLSQMHLESAIEKEKKLEAKRLTSLPSEHVMQLIKNELASFSPNLSKIRLLLENCDPKILLQQDGNGNNLLHWASCRRNQLGVAKLLIEAVLKASHENRAAFWQQNNQGDCPCHIAILHNQLAIFALFVEKAGEEVLTRPGAQGFTPLHLAAANPAIAKFIVDLADASALFAKNDQGKAPLELAINADCGPTVRLFIEKGGPPVLEHKDSTNELPLHKAILLGKDAATHQILGLSDMRMLLQPDQQRNTALHIALMHNNFTAAKRILNANADILLTVANKIGVTPQDLLDSSFLAAVVHHDLKAARRLLKQYGSQILWETDNKGNNALHLSMYNYKMMRLIVSAGGAPLLLQKNAWGQVPLHLALLNKLDTAIKYFVSVGGMRPITIADNSGYTPLHAAVAFKKRRAVQLMLARSNQKPLFQRIPNGDTALHLAIMAGDFGMAKILVAHSGPQALWQQDNAGNTALHAATLCKKFNPAVIELLINAGIDPTLKGINGFTYTYLLHHVRNQEICDFPLVNENASYDDEYRFRKLLTHLFSVNLQQTKLDDVTFRLPGANYALTRQEQLRLFTQFADLQQVESVKTVCALLKESAALEQTNPATVFEHIRGRGNIVLGSGSIDHIIAVGIIDDYLTIVTRTTDQESAVMVYRIDRSKITLREVELIMNRERTLKEAMQYLFYVLPEKIRDRSCDQSLDLIKQVVEERCALKPQKIGNCAWVSPKLAAKVLLGLGEIRRVVSFVEDPKNHFNVAQKYKMYKKAFKMGEKYYKYYAEYTRFALLKDYLTFKLEEKKNVLVRRFEPDLDLLREVSAKFYRRAEKVL